MDEKWVLLKGNEQWWMKFIHYKKKDDDEWLFSNGWSKKPCWWIFSSNVSLRFSMLRSFETWSQINISQNPIDLVKSNTLHEMWFQHLSIWKVLGKLYKIVVKNVKAIGLPSFCYKWVKNLDMLKRNDHTRQNLVKSSYGWLQLVIHDKIKRKKNPWL